MLVIVASCEIDYTVIEFVDLQKLMKNPNILASLNDKFSDYIPASTLLDQIAECANPAVVDWNGSLVSQTEPIILRDDAVKSLEFMIARAITPFIVTLASDWADIHELLASQMTNVVERVVIMTNQSWAPYHPYPPWRKHLRQLFPGSYAIPIIDNDNAAVTNNPGMRGYYVRTFKPESKILDLLNRYDYQTLWAATTAAVSDYVGS